MLLAALKLLPQGRGPSSHHLRSPLGQGRARGASLLSNEFSPPNGRRPPPLTKEPLANIRRVKPSVLPYNLAGRLRNPTVHRHHRQRLLRGRLLGPPGFLI